MLIFYTEMSHSYIKTVHSYIELAAHSSRDMSHFFYRNVAFLHYAQMSIYYIHIMLHLCILVTFFHRHVIFLHRHVTIFIEMLHS